MYPPKRSLAASSEKNNRKIHSKPKIKSCGKSWLKRKKKKKNSWLKKKKKRKKERDCQHIFSLLRVTSSSGCDTDTSQHRDSKQGQSWRCSRAALGYPSTGDSSVPPPPERHIWLLAKSTVLAGTHRSVFLFLRFFFVYFCISCSRVSQGGEAPAASQPCAHRDHQEFQQAQAAPWEKPSLKYKTSKTPRG